MKNRTLCFLIALLQIGVFVCAILWPSIDNLMVSSPEIFMGQVTLARETKPYSTNAYQSAEFVLDQVSLSEIEQAFFIVIQDDVLFWDHQYVGFARTKLNDEEIDVLQRLLSSGNLFSRMPDGESYKCVVRNSPKETALKSCSEGRRYSDQYVSYQWEAIQNQDVGVLQFFLTGGRLAEVRVYRSGRGIAYSPVEKSGDWWINGVAASSSLMKKLASRAAIPSVSILWPKLTAWQANLRAASIIGRRYQPALEFVQSSPAVNETFGEIREIRPATGINYYSSWMDAKSVFLTFRVVGVRGEGAVIVQGYDCFNLRMVFNGSPREGESDYECMEILTY